jgi:anti-sigma B factor antagonist
MKPGIVMKLKRSTGTLRVSEKPSTRMNAAGSSTIIRRKCVEFAVTTRTLDDVAIVSCGGKLVFEKEAAALCRVVSGLVKSYHRVIVNLNGVESIDGSGLGTLAQCIRDAKHSGASLIFCRVPKKIRELLDLTHLSQLVEIVGTETEALERSRAAA